MPNSKRAKTKKKYLHAHQANAMLPLLRSILRDVTAAGQRACTTVRSEFRRAKDCSEAVLSRSQRDELVHLEAEFERGRDRMHDYLEELDELGIELKDPFTGLVDFRAMMDGREVYLCWRLDEPKLPTGMNWTPALRAGKS